MALPKKKGRPFGSKNRQKSELEETIVGKAARPFDVSKRSLPEDAGELDKAIAPYMIYMRMPIKAISSGFELAGVSALDKDEMEAGQKAAAMLAYEYSAKMSGWFALAMFAMGVGAPRLLEFAEKRKTKKLGSNDGNVRLKDIKPPPSLQSVPANPMQATVQANPPNPLNSSLVKTT